MQDYTMHTRERVVITALITLAWGLSADRELQHAIQGNIALDLVSLCHGGASISMYIPQRHHVMVGSIEREGHIVPGEISWVCFLRLGYRVA